MKKLFIVCLLFLICFSKNNALESPDLRLLKLNHKATKIADSKGNKFLGYINWRTIDKNSNMFDIYVYEKYTIIQYNYDNAHKEDCIVCYLFDKSINFSNYQVKCKKIFYQNCVDERWHVIGVRGNFLFLDGGTAPTVRKLKVIDLISPRLIYNGVWDGASGKNKIDLINENEVIVYKLESSVKIGEDSYNYTLHAFSLNLHNCDIRDLGNTVSFIGN